MIEGYAWSCDPKERYRDAERPASGSAPGEKRRRSAPRTRAMAPIRVTDPAGLRPRSRLEQHGGCRFIQPPRRQSDPDPTIAIPPAPTVSAAPDSAPPTTSRVSSSPCWGGGSVPAKADFGRRHLGFRARSHQAGRAGCRSCATIPSESQIRSFSSGSDGKKKGLDIYMGFVFNPPLSNVETGLMVQG